MEIKVFLYGLSCNRMTIIDYAFNAVDSSSCEVSLEYIAKLVIAWWLYEVAHMLLIVTKVILTSKECI